ncbi:putative NBD/HSP70 family sugar kinase [Silvibacterium bohemicum]|uniref:Putative NBD/HSP70 family sugar kinase n=1 Tax=Silvibacterium bohemicum TaxID=1577686 RepID=A0A841JVP6_9BACT|nr:ROK family protein [Silvibacterium bohemicum]MBB6145220.1 putative NBD/HSP70 family sugar kinase [Silvibacterium bohemicum]
MKPVARSEPATRGFKRIDLAYVELASSENARDINRDIVLEIIRSRQPVARADLARASGLQPSTISAIVEQLLQEKWVKEGAIARRPRGRRPTLLSLNDELVILTADVRPNQAIVAVVDLNGRFLAREVVPLVSEPERAIGKIVQSMELMRASHRDRSFEGIGVSLPGRVDPESQRLILAPNLKWGDYDIKRAIEEKMHLQVELANAANACLLSELWSGKLDGVRNAVLVTVSEGIGAAILANGQIITSRSGLAGEFGHSPIDPTGPVCGCGQHGCWEVFASSNAALRYYSELAPKSRAANIHDLLQRAEEGDTKAVSAVSRQASFVGRGLRLITAALSPEVILITGDLTTSWSRFGHLIQSELENTMLAGPAPRLGITNDGELSRLRGAAAVVLQRHSGYRRSSLNASRSGRRVANAHK